jgi:hypothetical protein
MQTLFSPLCLLGNPPEAGIRWGGQKFILIQLIMLYRQDIAFSLILSRIDLQGGRIDQIRLNTMSCLSDNLRIENSQRMGNC